MRRPLILVVSLTVAAACGGRSGLGPSGVPSAEAGGGGSAADAGNGDRDGGGDGSSSGGSGSGSSSSGATIDSGMDGYPDFPNYDALPPACNGAEQTGMACSDIGIMCTLPYTVGNCHARECDCNPPGVFNCFELDCTDGGPLSDGSLVDSSVACPPSEPEPGSPCFDNSLVCTYSNGCDTNCLCRGLWYCATESPCSSPRGD
jgi:hypothetical protein